MAGPFKNPPGLCCWYYFENFKKNVSFSFYELIFELAILAVLFLEIAIPVVF